MFVKENRTDKGEKAPSDRGNFGQNTSYTSHPFILSFTIPEMMSMISHSIILTTGFSECMNYLSAYLGGILLIKNN